MKNFERKSTLIDDNFNLKIKKNILEIYKDLKKMKLKKKRRDNLKVPFLDL